MASAEKKCPFCAELIKFEALRCRYCGADLVQRSIPTKSSFFPWKWIFGVPVGLFVAVMVIGTMSGSPEKSIARDAIDHCWKSVDDELLPMNARRLARSACLKMNDDVEQKYGYSTFLRRY